MKDNVRMGLGRLDSIFRSFWGAEWCFFFMAVTCSVTFAFHGCRGLKVQSLFRPFVFECIQKLAQIHEQRVATNKKSRFSMSTEHLPVEEYRENRNLKDMMTHHVPSIHGIFTISRMIFCL